MLSRLALAVLIAIGSAGTAGAQAAATVFSANASENVKPMTGVGLYSSKHDFGYYVNGGVSLTNTSPYYSALTPDSTGDSITDRFGTGYFLNIGASMPVGEMVRIYGGVGVAGVAGKAQLHDPTNTLSANGSYYTPDAAADSYGANYNAGVLVSTGNMVLEAGYNSYFDSGYLGIGFGF